MGVGVGGGGRGRWGGSLEYPDKIVGVIETFGTAAWRATMTCRPFGSVRSTRGASWNGRSGPTAGRPAAGVCASAVVAVSATSIAVMEVFIAHLRLRDGDRSTCDWPARGTSSPPAAHPPW